MDINMKEELKLIFSTLPKRIIISLLVTTLVIIVGLVGYIGRSWFNSWQEEQDNNSKSIERLEQVIIEGFEATQTEFTNQNMLILELKQKQEVIIEHQSTETKKQLKQIENIYNELKKNDISKKNDETSLVPVSAKATLLTYNMPDNIILEPDTIKKKIYLNEF